MNGEEARYALEPTPFRTLREAQELTETLEYNMAGVSLGAANTRARLVEIFSEIIINNAADHGASPAGASCPTANPNFAPITDETSPTGGIPMPAPQVRFLKDTPAPLSGITRRAVHGILLLHVQKPQPSHPWQTG